jgi:hypothetical protein
MDLTSDTIDAEPSAALAALRDAWRAKWPGALACWSRYVQLSEPRWCLNASDEKREHLQGSFAMIRLVDHAVVISLSQVRNQGLDEFSIEIMAHEIGHHVYTPADLSDNARMLARIRAGLPTKERLAPWIANLYEDLLINDRLQRVAGLNMAGVYQRLGKGSADPIWTLYMRIYESLWRLERGTLTEGAADARLNADAQMGTRLIRSYAKQWLDGAGKFAALCLPYILETDERRCQLAFGPWHDTLNAGAGGWPAGLCEIDEEEITGAVHPALDEALSGIDDELPAIDGPEAAEHVGNKRGETGRKTLRQYRGPVEYAEILRVSGVELDEATIVARYYRERAMPYLVKFPTMPPRQAVDPLPEGLDVWDIGSPLEDIDWLGTALTSPVIVPGQSTRRRLYGTSPGTAPFSEPIDLYLGIDCSGSMRNPAHALSYPVLAGAVMALSALRAGSKVMAVLSGEPGKTVGTEGFVRDEWTILRTLTGYLGTGTTFGIHRLDETFGARTEANRAVHIVIVTDNDIFGMLDSENKKRGGWGAAADAVRRARGGGTFVLDLPRYLQDWAEARTQMALGMERMREIGWQVATVSTMEDLLEFARRFSQANYGH